MSDNHGFMNDLDQWLYLETDSINDNIKSMKSDFESFKLEFLDFKQIMMAQTLHNPPIYTWWTFIWHSNLQF